MKIQNMIDLVSYREEISSTWPSGEKHMSEELQQAIQNLIYRLREEGPIQSQSLSHRNSANVDEKAG